MPGAWSNAGLVRGAIALRARAASLSPQQSEEITAVRTVEKAVFGWLTGLLGAALFLATSAIQAQSPPPVQPTVYFTSSSFNVNESNSYVSIYFALSAMTSQNVSVDILVTDGTAKYGKDYGGQQKYPMTIQAGSTTGYLMISIVNDDDDEPDEAFNLQLDNAVNATLGNPSTATVTIYDDDAPPIVTFNPTELDVLEGDSESLIATVAPSTKASGVSYAAANAAIAMVMSGMPGSGGTQQVTVYGMSAGTTLLQAVFKQKVIATADITVIKVTFSPTPLDIAEGAEEALTATVNPTTAASKIAFSSSDTAVATLSGTAPNLKVKGVKAGATKVQAKLGTKIAKEVTVTVISVTFDPDPVVAVEGKTASLKATVVPAGSEMKVAFDTADNTIATAAGMAPTVTVTGVKQGQTEVRGKVSGKVAGKVTAYVVKVKLLEVKFQDGFDVVNDQYTLYTTPQWKNNAPAPDQQYPVCYERNTRMKVGAKIEVAPAVPAAVEARIRIKGTWDMMKNIGGATTGTVKLTGGVLELSPLPADDAFDDKVQRMNPLQISWEVSFQKGDAGTFAPAGSSKTPAYITWAKPTTAPVIHTLAQIGCSAADGIGGKTGTADDKILDAIWSAIAAKDLHRVSDNAALTYYGYFDGNGNKTYDGKPLDDGDYNAPGGVGNTIIKAVDLIKVGNGQCRSWVDLFMKTMQTQGLSDVNGQATKMVSVVIKPLRVDTASFAVKNWAKTGKSPHSIISWDAGVDGKAAKAPDVTKDEAADAAGAAGQGTSPNPPPMFANHFIVKMNGKYYDPSYGIGEHTDFRKYEEEAFAGSIDFDFTVDPPIPRMLYALPPDDGNPLNDADEICKYKEL
ncbi:MAG: Ig-like domain-containing protein [Nitrospiraceae bacterium]|nr:Ig-like domain-containing protein [Nitrospiraceae bacterium]